MRNIQAADCLDNKEGVICHGCPFYLIYLGALESVDHDRTERRICCHFGDDIPCRNSSENQFSRIRRRGNFPFFLLGGQSNLQVAASSSGGSHSPQSF